MPLEFLGERNRLTSVRCMATRLSDKLDSGGRRSPEPVPGSEYSLPADFAVVSVGLVSDYRREINVNPDLSTSLAGVFAGGDWARGARTIVEAVRDGKLAAEAMVKYVEASANPA
jgi:NADPH-dependent glutamate synthase beta subunit-like oxidoreductase